jgi:ubiquinone/menaquinone biosynthesis C-methylase UbiE
MPFKTLDEKEIKRLNRLQQERFDELVDMFEPPLQDGVPERLERIVAAAEIKKGEIVLDVGTGTGILMPVIQNYRPGRIYACDLSDEMLKQLRKNYSGVETILSDVRDLTLPDASVDVVFINACYPNIVDKAGAFKNVARIMIPAGRLIISHPLGKRFVDRLRRNSPFPFDDFPEKSDAEKFFIPYGFRVEKLVDEPELYILNISRRPTQTTADK